MTWARSAPYVAAAVHARDESWQAVALNPDPESLTPINRVNACGSLGPPAHLLVLSKHPMILRQHLGYALCYGRAAAIDRGIHVEAAAAGLLMREVAGTRQCVAGGLEGVVFRCRHSTC